MSSCSYSWYKTCLAKQCLHETKSLCSDSEIEFQNLKTFHLTAIISVSRSQMTPFLYWNFRQWKTKIMGKVQFFCIFRPLSPHHNVEKPVKSQCFTTQLPGLQHWDGGRGGWIMDWIPIIFCLWLSEIHKFTKRIIPAN